MRKSLCVVMMVALLAGNGMADLFYFRTNAPGDDVSWTDLGNWQSPINVAAARLPTSTLVNEQAWIGHGYATPGMVIRNGEIGSVYILYGSGNAANARSYDLTIEAGGKLDIRNSLYINTHTWTNPVGVVDVRGELALTDTTALIMVALGDIGTAPAGSKGTGTLVVNGGMVTARTIIIADNLTTAVGHVQLNAGTINLIGSTANGYLQMKGWGTKGGTMDITGGVLRMFGAESAFTFINHYVNGTGALTGYGSAANVRWQYDANLVSPVNPAVKGAMVIWADRGQVPSQCGQAYPEGSLNWQNVLSGFDSYNVYLGRSSQEVYSVQTTPACGDILGDINGDCAVDIEDLQRLIDCWLSPAVCDPFADLDNNGTVRLSDFAKIAGDWLLSAPFLGDQTATSYPFAGLDVGKTYYWRIDGIKNGQVTREIQSHFEVVPAPWDGVGVCFGVHPSNESSFTGLKSWGTDAAGDYEAARYLEGDYNGDGKTDIAAVWYSPNGNANITVYVSTGTAFTAQTWKTDSGEMNEKQIWMSGDYNGDGKCDLVKVFASNNTVCAAVYSSTGSAFNNPVQWATEQGGIWDTMVWMSGDYNGDGKCDIMKVWDDGGLVCADVHISTGSAFSPQRWATNQGGIWDSMIWMSGDYNGDGKCDVMKIWNDGGGMYADVHASTGSAFTPQRWATNNGGIWREMRWMSGDYNNDGKCDLSVVFKGGSGNMDAMVQLSSGSSFSSPSAWATNQGGFSGSQQWFSGNFNGSGGCDIAKLYLQYNLPKVVATVYPTDDHVVIDTCAIDYGADRTGVFDSTAAIQTALDVAANAGGGTAWLPAGTYRVTNTIMIPGNVCLRGDWDNPELDADIRGTIIYAEVPVNSSVFSIGSTFGSSGVKGIAVYYPNQNADSPIAYEYTFYIPGSASCSVENCTLINSYKGLYHGSVTKDWNFMMRFKHIYGTALYNGMAVYNSLDVGTAENMNFSNTYWANAGPRFKAPSITTLNNYTRANGIGYITGTLEWSQFYRTNCSNYLVGIQFVLGPRVYQQTNWFDCEVLNCQTAVQALPNSIDSRWGMGFERGILQGTTCVDNQSVGYIRLTAVSTSGTFSGTVHNDPRNVGPVGGTMAASPKVSNKTLYVVTAAPYNAPRTVLGSDLTNELPFPAADATNAIQSALTAAGNAGGGVVYLPAGWYRIDGNLTVPANVELRGASSIQFRTFWERARTTWLFCYAGKNANWQTGTAAVTLGGNNSGISGIGFFYPEQNPQVNSSILSYPPSIKGTSGSNMYVNNISFYNSYVGMMLTSQNHYVRNVLGGAFYRLGYFANSPGQISSTLNNTWLIMYPAWGSPWVRMTQDRWFNFVLPWTKSNMRMFEFHNIQGEKVINAFVYGANNFASFNNQCSIDVINAGTDNLGGAGFNMASGAGTVRVGNYARWGGTGSSGTGASIYNHMVISGGYIPNP